MSVATSNRSNVFSGQLSLQACAPSTTSNTIILHITLSNYIFLYSVRCLQKTVQMSLFYGHPLTDYSVSFQNVPVAMFFNTKNVEILLNS